MKYSVCTSCEHFNEGSTKTICANCEKRGYCLPSNYEVDASIPVKPKAEEVNHPDHYKTGKFECIEVMAEVFGIEATQTFCEMNAFKYLWRGDHKGKKAVDVEKAHWYLGEYLKLEGMKKDELLPR